MTRLAQRVEGALRLQPMTIHQVARCLCVSDSCAQQCLTALTKRRIVRRRGWAMVNKHPVHLFELAQCHPLNAQDTP